jgi:hypothetical protein
MYKFHYFDFSEKEIDQILSLIDGWCAGLNRPIDRRRYTKNVVSYAHRFGLLCLGSELKHRYNYQTQETELPEMGKKYPNRYFFERESRKFDFLHDCPIEILWRLVEPIIDESSGYYTILKHKGWGRLNMWCSQDSEWERYNEWELKENNRKVYWRDERYIPFMMSVLNRLSVYGFIIFQYAGTIWQVTKIRKD